MRFRCIGLKYFLLNTGSIALNGETAIEVSHDAFFLNGRTFGTTGLSFDLPFF